MESRKHKQIAEKLARLKGSEYHSDKGIDIRTKTQAIEVEVFAECLGHAKKQLAGTTRAPYIAVPKEIKKEALESVKGTRFGLMTSSGVIVKRGRKKD